MAYNNIFNCSVLIHNSPSSMINNCLNYCNGILNNCVCNCLTNYNKEDTGINIPIIFVHDFVKLII